MIFKLYQALVARLIDVGANIGIISGVLVTVGDLARVVSKLSFFVPFVFIVNLLIWAVVMVLFREVLQ
jgi:hypothetical protein